MNPDIDRYARHVNPSFVRLLGMWNYGRVWTRAEGCWLEDSEGRRYLDLLAGFGSFPLGHAHPAILDTLAAYARDLPLNLAHMGIGPEVGLLAERLAGITPGDLDLALFCSSGAEAVEAGIKIAMVATGRSRVLSCEAGYHGTNLGVLGLSGNARMRSPFAAVLPPRNAVGFGDLDGLRVALAGRDVAAFVVEPVQAEGGINLPDRAYLGKAAELCRAAGTLLVVDEVQTGLGRTGRWFCTGEVVPDVLVLGKALGAGLVPVSAAMVSPALFKRAYGSMDRFDLQSSTYGGNALGCRVGLAVIEALDGELDSVARRGERLLAGLRERLDGHPFVRDVRGVGMLIGIELGPTGQGWMDKLAPSLVHGLSEQLFGQWTALRLLEAGVVAQPTANRWDVMRIEPPLLISDEQVELGIERVASVFEALPTLAGLLADIAKRTTRQAAGGFAVR